MNYLIHKMTEEHKEKLHLIPIESLNNYKITQSGKIWSYYSNKFLATRIHNGYHTIALAKTDYSIHKLVAITFIPNPNQYEIINHIDEDKLNNHVSNLEWTTQKDNIRKCSKDTSHPQEIIQLDLNGNQIAIHKSILDAANAVNRNKSSISSVLRGKSKMSAGFVWKYKDKTQEIQIDIDLSNSKLIQNYDNYRIFSDSRIYSTTFKRFLKPVKNESGYCYITLCKKDTKKKNFYIHVLVASHFIHNNNPENKTQVNHKDKKRDNNHIDNLEWVTPSENMFHCITYNTKSN